MMKEHSWLVLFWVLHILCRPSHGTGSYTHHNWKFHFPQGSSMGIFLAIALPLELPSNSAYFSYNFEANYALPNYTQTELQYPPLLSREVSRKMMYDVLELKLQNNGYPGKDCLLRTICEAAAAPIHEISGVLGEMVHILLTPSSSKAEPNMTSEYRKAEIEGSKTKECTAYKKNCTVSVLNLFSWIGSIM